MSPRRFADAKALLHDLLDRHEARPGRERILAYLDEDGFSSVRKLTACMSLLDAAERAGGVIVARRHADGVNRVLHIRLAEVNALYGYLGRAPSSHRAELALAPMFADASGELAAVHMEISDAWSRNVSRYGLRPGASRSVRHALSLVLALQARHAEPGLAEIDYRSFSRAAAGDSKALERLASPVIQFLRRLTPAAVPEGLSDPDILASLGVTRLPQPLLVSGPVAWERQPIRHLTYLGLPPEAALNLTLSRRVSYVLTIENFTSFVRHAREINLDGDGLVIFSGGFPARSVLRAIVALAEKAKVQTYHWGDLDPGGLRIFRHLERALAPAGVSLQPHLMTEALLKSFGLPGSGERGLKLGDACDSAVAAIWDIVAADPQRRTLEQEALAPCRPRPGDRS